MPKLAIVDHVMSAGGVERFLHGLVGGMLPLKEFSSWDVTVMLAKRNSAWKPVAWPDDLRAANIEVRLMMDDSRVEKLIERTSKPGRYHGIPGTSKGRRYLNRALVKAGSGAADYFSYQKKWIERACEKEGFDLFYSSYPYRMDCPAISMPLVCTPHDLTFMHLEELSPAERDLVSRQLDGWLERSSAVVASCEFIAGELERHFASSRGKVRVVRLGIPERAGRVSDEDRLEARGNLGLPERFVLTVGWVTPHKNQKVIFEALGLLRARDPGIGLVCVGPNSEVLRPGGPEMSEVSADYAAEVLETARRLGLAYGRDYVTAGYVSDSELDSLYSMATALVVPSYYEAGSFPAREAMRFGCPVVYSSIPPLLEEYELVGENAWVFDPDDPEDLARVLLEIIEDPEGASLKARRAAEAAPEAFSWEKTARGYLEVFEKVLGSRS